MTEAVSTATAKFDDRFALVRVSAADSILMKPHDTNRTPVMVLGAALLFAALATPARADAPLGDDPHFIDSASGQSRPALEPAAHAD